jgi:hypothetical protein
MGLGPNVHELLVGGPAGVMQRCLVGRRGQEDHRPTSLL